MTRRLIHTETGTAALQHLVAKVYRDAEWNEWRVTFYENGAKLAGADYHTGDKQDAVDTAHTYVSPKAAPVSLVSVFCAVAFPHDAHVAAYRAFTRFARRIAGQAFKALMTANREGRAYSHTDTHTVIVDHHSMPQDAYARTHLAWAESLHTHARCAMHRPDTKTSVQFAKWRL